MNVEHLFLIRYPEKPILLSQNRKASIGRARENDIRLTEQRVSRKHAVIGWLRFQQSFSISDMGSLNGTFLNGVKLPPYHATLLHDHDKLRIASVVFTIRIVADPAAISGELASPAAIQQEEGTQIIHLESLAPGDEPGFSGNLGHICPLEVFQMLDSAGKTGLLSLQTPGGRGRFLLSNGKIADASFDNLTGEQAVYASLRCCAGSFSFTAQEVKVAAPEQLLNTAFLLIEGCRLLDEESRTI